MTLERQPRLSAGAQSGWSWTLRKPPTVSPSTRMRTGNLSTSASATVVPSGASTATCQRLPDSRPSLRPGAAGASIRRVSSKPLPSMPFGDGSLSGASNTRGTSRPIALSDISAGLRSALNGAALRAVVGAEISLDATTPLSAAVMDLRKHSGDPPIFPREVSDWSDRPFDLTAPVTEWKLYSAMSADVHNLPFQATASIALLLLTASRFDHAAHRFRPDWQLARAGGSARLSLDRFIGLLRRSEASDASVGELAESVLRSYVISQHARVANSKLPYDTFRFVQEGDRLRFFDRPRPLGLNSARFDTLANVASDLDLSGPLRCRTTRSRRMGLLLSTGAWQDRHDGNTPTECCRGHQRAVGARDSRYLWPEPGFWERAILPLLPSTRGRIVLADSDHELRTKPTRLGGAWFGT